MVLLLAECLDVPLRDRNALLLAAGFAPAYRERRLDDPEMVTVRTSLEHILAGQEPYPAVVVDRRWDAVLANQAAQIFLVDVDPELLSPAPNVFRLSLHPEGLGGRILNFEEYAGHVIGRLQRLVLLTGDEHLEALLDEVLEYPGVAEARHHVEAPSELVLPLRIRVGDDVLSLCSTVATFGTAVDITLAELLGGVVPPCRRVDRGGPASPGRRRGVSVSPPPSRRRSGPRPRGSARPGCRPPR